MASLSNGRSSNHQEMTEGSFIAVERGQGGRVACFSEDNRLKVWEVSSGRLTQTCVKQDQMAGGYTSISWSSSSFDKKHRGLLALGTTVGSVLIWDLNRGQLLQTLSTQGKVWDVCFSLSGKTLWSSGADGFISEWNLKTGECTKKWKGEKGEVRKLCIVKSGESSEGRLLSGRCRVKLWDLATKKNLLKLPGHNSPLLDMRASQDGSFCVTCASGDRYVSVWSLDVENPSSQPICVLVCDHFVRQLSIQVSRKGKNGPDTPRSKKKKKGKKEEIQCQVSGATSNGSQIALWSSSVSSPSSKPVQPQGIISRKAAKDPFLHAEFCANSSQQNLLIARGLRLKPIFDIVEVRDEDGPLRSIEVDPIPSRLGPVPNSKETEEFAEGTIVSGLNSKSQKAQDPSQQDAILLAKKLKEKEKEKPNVSVIDTRSFLEKLDAMEQHVTRTSSKQKNHGNTPKAGSLQSAIEQAIHSDDPALLESCLDINVETTIRSTCQRLSIPYIVPFLLSLIKRFEANPNRAGALIPWIRALLLFHGSYLMTLSDIEDSLGKLHDLIELRLKSFTSLLKLSGRLDILLSQMAVRERSQRAAGSSSASVVLFETDEGLVSADEDESEEESDLDEFEEREDDLDDGVMYMTPDEEEDEEDSDGVMYETPDEEEEESDSDGEVSSVSSDSDSSSGESEESEVSDS